MTETIAHLAAEENLARLATPSDRRLGREIAAQGGVVLTSVAPRHVTALVTPRGGQRRTVEMTADGTGLHCRCT